jgi:hypothetical protein
MAHSLEKVQVSIDDSNCRGVTSSNGLVRYDAKDHVVEVPRIEAEKILKAGHPGAKSYSKIYSVGIDLKAIRQAKGE